MRAVVIAGDLLNVEQRDDLIPGPGEVVVNVRAAGLNSADLLQRRGFYPAPPGWPSDIPGLEVAGDIRSLGAGVSGWTVGERVCAIVGGGAQATQCVVPAEHLLPVPKGLEITAAGGFAEAFTTAYDALVRQADIRQGERVVISGAAGGVGCAAIQIARAWGAIPIAVARDERNDERLRSLGAEEIVRVEDVETLAPVDVVLELVGAAHFQHAQKVLAPRARVVIIGVGGGGRVEVDLLSVMSKRISITGSTLRARDRVEKAQIAAEMTEHLIPLWAAGRLRVPVSSTYAIDRVEEAYASFAVPGKFGKIILTTNDGR